MHVMRRWRPVMIYTGVDVLKARWQLANTTIAAIAIVCKVYLHPLRANLSSNVLLESLLLLFRLFVV